MEIIDGIIKNYDEHGRITAIADYHDIDKFVKRGYRTCRIVLNDSREISDEQRKKAYALIGEIADYMGEMPEYAKRLFKLKFIHDEMKGMADGIFSLGSCDMTTAKEFITYLVDFIISHEIPTRVPLVDLCDDITHYVYACAINKKCCVCGRKAEIHHIDRVGMGFDRTKISHLVKLVVPLCREHHTEAEQTIDGEFMEKYHIEPIPLDEKLCKKWGLKK